MGCLLVERGIEGMRVVVRVTGRRLRRIGAAIIVDMIVSTWESGLDC